MDHTSCLKVPKLTCFWTAHVTHFNHRWWLFNGTDSVIIRVLICLNSLFFFFSLSLLSLFIESSIQQFYILMESYKYKIITTHESHMSFVISKLYYFFKYFLHRDIFFFPMLETKSTKKIWYKCSWYMKVCLKGLCKANKANRYWWK